MCSSSSSIPDLSEAQTVQYCQKKYEKNCEISKQLGIMPDNWKESDFHKILKHIIHYFKKWKASTASDALESSVRTFMDNLDLMDKNVFLSLEIDKLQLFSNKTQELSQVMEKSLNYNNENLNEMKECLNDEKDPFIIDLMEEIGILPFERINKLLILAEQQEKEIEELTRGMKKL